MQHEECETCATKRMPMKMFCLSYSGVSRSSCYKHWEPPSSSLHLNDTDKYYFHLGPEFSHHTETLIGYCAAFFRCRCTDLAYFPWYCPHIQILYLWNAVHCRSCLRSLDRQNVLCYKQLVSTCTSHPRQTFLSFSISICCSHFFSLLPIHITLCVYLTPPQLSSSSFLLSLA